MGEGFMMPGLVVLQTRVRSFGLAADLFKPLFSENPNATLFFLPIMLGFNHWSDSIDGAEGAADCKFHHVCPIFLSC